ncbi:MAG: SIR2 family protein [Roseivirga sp.]|nr:SIR2 family protein [Roseivirga sp.]
MKDEDSVDVISFIQGGQHLETGSSLDGIKQKLAELSNVKNLSFLLGAGASADAIPSMVEMYKEITQEVNDADEKHVSAQNKALYSSISKTNLEDVLNILYAKKAYLEGVSKLETQADASARVDANVDASVDTDAGAGVDQLIKFIEGRMFSKININLDDAKYVNSLNLYKELYQKTALRNKDLSRINIFTTNNDLLNEKALDNLNINYNNGFGGGLDRVFNPARFHYTFSQKIDANLEKFEPLENMVYLYKLHGSISWIEQEGNSLFNIKEIPVVGGVDADTSNHVLIYPTPLKQSQSLGSPYSDLIREFQTKISQPNSVIFIIGYSFSDDHLNNIIYQALASNSSISVVIFGDYKDCPLTKINDNRIYQIFGKNGGHKIHYFEFIVNNLLPNLDENKETVLLDKFISALKGVEDSGEKT